MESTYWNNQGRYQAQYNELVKLMPFFGPAETLAGELIRAVSKLGYDFYNNGMGNNTSGAVNFLNHHSAIDAGVFDTIYEYSRGKTYEGKYKGDALQLAIERAVDQTVEMITRNPQLITMPNKDDMLLHEDEDESYYYDEEEEYED